MSEITKEMVDDFKRRTRENIHSILAGARAGEFQKYCIINGTPHSRRSLEATIRNNFSEDLNPPLPGSRDIRGGYALLANDYPAALAMYAALGCEDVELALKTFDKMYEPIKNGGSAAEFCRNFCIFIEIVNFRSCLAFFLGELPTDTYVIRELAEVVDKDDDPNALNEKGLGRYFYDGRKVMKLDRRMSTSISFEEFSRLS